MPTRHHRGRIEQLDLPRDGEPRRVRVYLPPGYSPSSAPYPVLYMFDGQNLFADSSATRGMGWHIDDTIAELTSTDPTLATVVVGIDSPQQGAERVAELSLGDWQFPTADVMPELGPVVDIHGTGEVTAEFLVTVVKPHIERNYAVARDRDRVAVGGSSLGAFMALYCMATHPEQFGVVLGLSPAVFDEPMRGDRLREILRQSRHPTATRVYLDMGGSENLHYYGDVVATLQPLAESLRASGHVDPVSVVFASHSHDERSWAQRIGAALRWGLHNGPAPSAD